MTGGRRDKGGGSVYYDASKNRWVAAFDDGFTDSGKRRRVKRMFKTEAEAIEAIGGTAAVQSPPDPSPSRAKRRSQGDGSIYFDAKKDRWVVAFDNGMTASGKRRRVKRFFDTKSEAVKAARVLGRMLDENEPILAMTDTFGDLVDQWLAYQRDRAGEATLDATYYRMKNHIVVLRRRSLSKLSAYDIEVALRIASESVSYDTVLRLRSTLKRICDYGIARRVLQWNPAAVAAVPLREECHQERLQHRGTLTPEEATTFINAAQGHVLEAWITTATLMGLRPGELSGLTWDAVDFTAGVIHIRQQLVWAKSQPAIKPRPKTTKGFRKLAMPNLVIESLLRHKERQDDEKGISPWAWPSEWDDLVFRSSRGTPLNPSNIRRMFREISEVAGFPRPLRPYELRHTFSTLMSSHMTLQQMIDWSGHTDERMHIRTYRHRVNDVIEIPIHMDEVLGLSDE